MFFKKKEKVNFYEMGSFDKLLPFMVQAYVSISVTANLTDETSPEVLQLVRDEAEKALKLFREL